MRRIRRSRQRSAILLATIVDYSMLESPIMPDAKTIAVVMPAHNEAAVIGSVLARVPARIEGFEVVTIVVDDGSRDDTAEVALQHGAYVVRHLTNLGVGAATVTGLRAARSLQSEVIVTIDADGQHDPSEIEPLVECLIDGPFDIVIGSRLLHPAGMPLSRIGANLLLNALTYVVYGKIVSDSQSGFKAFSRHALEVMDLRSAGYEICSEIVGEMYRRNLRYKSLPVKAVYTKYSRAKGQPFLNGVNLILGLLMRLVRRV
jgi:glycosyltransferase involved in cell wall biosynthesis